MAAPLEARQKQRAVIEFLVAEGETPLRIYNRLKNVYKDNTIDQGWPNYGLQATSGPPIHSIRPAADISQFF